MRWTEENKSILWRTIFETQNLHIDLVKLSAGWPGEEKPTPKALKEHLDRYRKNLKGDNVVTFSRGTKRKGDGEDNTPVSTPRKKLATPKKSTPTKKKVVKKEATSDKDEQQEDDHGLLSFIKNEEEEEQ